MALTPAPIAGWLCLYALAPSLALAQTLPTPEPTLTTDPASVAAPNDAAAPPHAPVTEQLVPPKPLMAEIPYPASGPQTGAPVDVTVLLRVDTEGQVSAVRLLTGAGPPFDEAVLTGATAFRFTPATFAGEPVEIDITYTQRFVPPTQPQANTTMAPQNPSALLSGHVVERGTRKPVANATVVVQTGATTTNTTTDADGHFSLPVSAGSAHVRVLALDYLAFTQTEQLAADQQLHVKYLLERSTYNPFETVVLGQRERLEVSRTSLRDREIKNVPGTFGDPFRVIMTLPGVSSMMGLLPLPIVRGAGPGSTAFFVDGVRVPMLYHFLAGPSVIHPEFIDHVEFYPGGFRSNYGSYTAGIVDGMTRATLPEESRYEVNLANTQAGILARDSFGKATGTVAGRIGFPGVMMSLAQVDESLSYWDYQARVDYALGATADERLTLFAFGANDHVTAQECPTDAYCDDSEKKTTTLLHLQFHRIDVVLRHTLHDFKTMSRVTFDYEESDFGEDTFRTRAPMLAPRITASRDVSATATLNLGVEGSLRQFKYDLKSSSESDATDQTDEEAIQPEEITINGGRMTSAATFADITWRPVPELLVVPGVRLDHYTHKRTTQWNVDPRLGARYRLDQGDDGDTWLKAATGIYHQPPRLFVPVPGLAESALDWGLLRAIHNVIGVEQGLGGGFEVDLQAYFNWLDPVFFEPDLVGTEIAENYSREPSAPPGTLPGNDPLPKPQDEGDTIEGLTRNRHGVGRAYGLELMLRRRQIGSVFGWLAYTLSKSERKVDSRWELFEYNRTHIVNVVVGVLLPRNWEAGVRMLVQSGTPLATVEGTSAGRSDWQVRFDIRFDKRAIWNDWLLDFYVDIINGTVSPESGGLMAGESFPYLIPTVGFRGVF